MENVGTPHTLARAPIFVHVHMEKWGREGARGGRGRVGGWEGDGQRASITKEAHWYRGLEWDSDKGIDRAIVQRFFNPCVLCGRA